MRNTTQTTSPVVGRTRAALLILEHAERIGLPIPFDVNVSLTLEPVAFLFRSLADLAQWALWVESPIVEESWANVAVGTALDQPVRLVHVELGKANR